MKSLEDEKQFRTMGDTYTGPKATTLPFRKFERTKKLYDRFPNSITTPLEGHADVKLNKSVNITDIYEPSELDIDFTFPLNLKVAKFYSEFPIKVDDWDWSKVTDIKGRKGYTINEYKEKLYRHGIIPSSSLKKKKDYINFMLENRGLFE